MSDDQSLNRIHERIDKLTETKLDRENFKDFREDFVRSFERIDSEINSIKNMVQQTNDNISNLLIDLQQIRSDVHDEPCIAMVKHLEEHTKKDDKNWDFKKAFWMQVLAGVVTILVTILLVKFGLK